MDNYFIRTIVSALDNYFTRTTVRKCANVLTLSKHSHYTQYLLSGGIVCETVATKSSVGEFYVCAGGLDF